MGNHDQFRLTEARVRRDFAAATNITDIIERMRRGPTDA